MLFKNFAAAATLATVLISVSLPSNAATIIKLPEQKLTVVGGPQAGDVGPYKYTGGGNSSKLDEGDDLLFQKGGDAKGDFKFITEKDVKDDTVFSYFSATGTATSASFKVTEALLTSLSSITLSFNYEVLKAGTLSTFLFDGTKETALKFQKDLELDKYLLATSDDFKGLLAKDVTYSILWKYDTTDKDAKAGFNNAVLEIATVPEPSEALGLLGFGLAVYGGALQKKRNLKRAA